MGYVLPMINLKGGVAKTSNVVAIAECLASQGKRTLVIDADHQSMAGELLLGEDRLIRSEKNRRTSYHLLAAMLDPEFHPKSFEGFTVGKASNIGAGLPTLSVLPCSLKLADFATNMAKAGKGYLTGREILQRWRAKKNALRKWLDTFEFVLIDCPPYISPQVSFFLSVSDAYIVPTIPDRLSTLGAHYLTERLAAHNYKVQGLGTLWTLVRSIAVHKTYQERTAAGHPPLDRLPPPFETVIAHAVKLADVAEPSNFYPSFKGKYKEFSHRYIDLCSEIEYRCNHWLSSPTPEIPSRSSISLLA